MNLENGNRWFYFIDRDECRGYRKSGLLVTGFGAVVTPALSSFSRGLGLMFGLGPVIIGLALVLFSFVPVPKPPPQPQRGIFWLLIGVNGLIDILGFLGLHFSAKVGRYVAVATLIYMFVQWFCRPTRSPLKSTN